METDQSVAAYREASREERSGVSACFRSRGTQLQPLRIHAPESLANTAGGRPTGGDWATGKMLARGIGRTSCALQTACNGPDLPPIPSGRLIASARCWDGRKTSPNRMNLAHPTSRHQILVYVDDVPVGAIPTRANVGDVAKLPPIDAIPQIRGIRGRLLYKTVSSMLTVPKTPSDPVPGCPNVASGL